jgi:hypothetical protein
MIERNILNYSELQTLIKALSKYKAFKNPELTRLIKKEITRLAESEKDDGTPRIALCSIL